MTPTQAAALPQWFVARIVPGGGLFVGIVLLVLTIVGVLQAPTRLSVWWLIENLPLSVLLIAVGVLWFGYPSALIALAIGLGSGATLITLWTRSRRKPPHHRTVGLTGSE